MKKMATIVSTVCIMAMLAGCGGGSKSGKVLVDINGNKITEGDLEFLGEVNPRIQAQLNTPSGKKRIMDNLVEQELLYQEAVKQGINRDTKVKDKVDLYRKVIIAQSLVDEEVDKASKKHYDENADEFKKLKMSHIMVKYYTPEQIKKAPKNQRKDMHTEKQALEIISEYKEKIDKGEEFQEVTKEYSEDIATKSRGGDLGLVSKGDKKLINRGYEPLVDKAFEMKVGSVSGPVKTSKGYHLVKVTKGAEMQPFEEVKESITFKVRGDARSDLLANLKKDSTIVYPEREKRKEEMLKMAKEASKKKKAEAAAKGEKVDAKGEDKKDTKPEAKKDAKPEAKKADDSKTETKTINMKDMMKKKK